MSTGAPARLESPQGPLVLGRWRPPFYYGWVIVGVFFVANFMASGMGGHTIPLFFGPMHESLGWSLTLFTGAVTASTLLGTAVIPFLGRVLDKVGPRPVMLWGAIAAGTGLLLMSRVTEVWQFWVLYASVGALGLHEIGSFSGSVVVSKWFIRKRGRALTISAYGGILSGIAMTPVIGLLLVHIGWRGTWAVMGLVMMAVMVPLVLIFMRHRPEDFGLLPDGDALPPASAADGTRHAKAAAPERSWTLREAMRTRTLWVLVVSMDLISFSSGVQAFHGITYLTQQEGLSVATVGLITTVRYVGVFLARIPWAYFLERVPVRKCLFVCFLVKATTLLWLIALPYPANIAGYIIAFSIGGAQGLVQPMVFANYFGRESQGTIQGAVQPALAVPTLVGPLLVAMVFDAVGSFNTAFIIASVLGFAAAVVALFAPPPVYRGRAVAAK